MKINWYVVIYFLGLIFYIWGAHYESVAGISRCRLETSGTYLQIIGVLFAFGQIIANSLLGKVLSRDSELGWIYKINWYFVLAILGVIFYLYEPAFLAGSGSGVSSSLASSGTILGATKLIMNAVALKKKAKNVN